MSLSPTIMAKRATSPPASSAMAVPGSGWRSGFGLGALSAPVDGARTGEVSPSASNSSQRQVGALVGADAERWRRRLLKPVQRRFQPLVRPGSRLAMRAAVGLDEPGPRGFGDLRVRVQRHRQPAAKPLLDQGARAACRRETARRRFRHMRQCRAFAQHARSTRRSGRGRCRPGCRRGRKRWSAPARTGDTERSGMLVACAFGSRKVAPALG